jgi:hypothetical protein
MELENEYYKEEIKRCFLCNKWIEGKLKRQLIFNKTYYYHYDCYCKLQKYHHKTINTLLMLK